MNSPAIILVLGIFLLLVPNTSWLGLGLLAIGAVAFMLDRREPLEIATGPPSILKRMQRPGVSWSIRQPLANQDNQPKLEKGMFSLPLPMGPEISRFVDVKYNAPTKARGFTEEQEKPGHPWFPGL